MLNAFDIGVRDGQLLKRAEDGVKTTTTPLTVGSEVSPAALQTGLGAGGAVGGYALAGGAMDAMGVKKKWARVLGQLLGAGAGAAAGIGFSDKAHDMLKDVPLGTRTTTTRTKTEATAAIPKSTTNYAGVPAVSPSGKNYGTGVIPSNFNNMPGAKAQAMENARGK